MEVRGCAVCGVRCMGEYHDDDDSDPVSELLPLWRLVSVADLQFFQDGLYVVSEDTVEQYRRENTLHQRAIVMVEGSQTYLKLQRRYVRQDYTGAEEQVVPRDAVAFVCTSQFG